MGQKMGWTGCQSYGIHFVNLYKNITINYCCAHNSTDQVLQKENPFAGHYLSYRGLHGFKFLFNHLRNYSQ